jgi:hydroxymethylbilane synthase
MAGAVRIGTRGSPLARWQAEWVAGQLRRHHPDRDVALVEIKTEGDRDQNSPLATIGGIGVFTKEIQRELLEGTIDLAVHSLKDLPTRGPTGLALAAVPPREEPGDALVAPTSRTLDALPGGARVGTGSLRRRAQLLYLRPDLEVVAVRGKVETRLDRVLQGRLDAVVLAEAGLRRLGLDRHVTERLAPPPSSRRWRRGRSASSAGPTTWPFGRCWPRWTTRRATAPCGPSGGCWPSWRAAA